MNTATPASPSPAHGTQAHATGARPAHLQGQRTPAPADLFADLLALAAEAAPGEAGDPLATADTVEQGAPQDPDDKDDPLAGLMFWQPQGPQAQAQATSAAGDGTRAGSTSTAMPDRAAADALREPSARTAEPAIPAPESGPAPGAAAPTNARPNGPAGPSWQVMASRAAQNAPASAGGDTPATRWTRATPEAPAHAPAWGLRSTVNLDPRFPATAQTAPGTAQVTASATGLTTAGAWADDAAAPANTGERAAIGGTALAAGPAASGSTAQTDMSGGQGGGEGSDTANTTPDVNGQSDDPGIAHASDAEAVDVQHWGGTHGLRHASLRFGEDAARAIDIQLALRGDEVQLDIRTDDSATRDALREQAQAALGERLQQGGLQLGNVSVGAQQQERQREGHTTTLPQARTGGESSAETAAPQQARAAERAGGLDLFI
jgi:flagellar hook-length control protein FliK